MGLKPLYRCVAALDVHQAKLTLCILYEDGAGELQVELREFGGFKRDRRAMAEWIASFQPEEVVMERDCAVIARVGWRLRRGRYGAAAAPVSGP